MPTTEEVACHEVAHLQPAVVRMQRQKKRSRCQAQSMLKKKNDVVPTIERDLFRDREESVGAVALEAAGRSRGHLIGTPVPLKGAECAYSLAAMAHWLREQGHLKVTLQSDGEPAPVAFRHAVRDKVATDHPRRRPNLFHEASHWWKVTNQTEEQNEQCQLGWKLETVYLDMLQDRTRAAASSPWWT